MRPSPATVASTAVASAVGALAFRHERRARTAADRLAAAALETLLNAIDANDLDTGEHVRRVAIYSLILADAAGLPGSTKRTIERVALFHDIGKIHEALIDIVHDDESLSPADRRAIATHPERGATVLQPLRSFYPELPAGVIAHHERWDGTGYPHRLRGDQIPIAARVVAICDTFDAVTHSRRYRDGRPVEVGREVILEGRETQFDPAFVDLFVFPPVFKRILAAERATHTEARPSDSRHSGRREKNVPDVTFRWRPPQI